ncbi:hypothetical protein BJ508DRAFT_410580 [Ascobolus immersus RN42]|uniref:NPCC-domain-containing protein n=1 Tax=Ascobolus immersus RN42 TaxID=1160509 RepID=A0A3N4IS00_ASCIM|nr:hypothetical protein BJ508DRAFT_410580 [Ascobolus immersus RN42]
MSAMPATPVKPAGEGDQSIHQTPTGSWRHPALDRIARQRRDDTFTDASVRRIAINFAGLVCTFVVFNHVKEYSLMKYLFRLLPKEIYNNSTYIIWLLRLLMVYNIAETINRAFTTENEFRNVPLTPQQRRLLGLNPNVPTPPDASLATPPRYAKTTPNSRSAPPTFTPAPDLRTGQTPSPSKRLFVPNQSVNSNALSTSTNNNQGSPLRQSVLSERRGSFTQSLAQAFPNLPPTPTPMGKNGNGGQSVMPTNRFFYEKMGRSRDSLGLSQRERGFNGGASFAGGY